MQTALVSGSNRPPTFLPQQQISNQPVQPPSQMLSQSRSSNQLHYGAPNQGATVTPNNGNLYQPQQYQPPNLSDQYPQQTANQNMQSIVPRNYQQYQSTPHQINSANTAVPPQVTNQPNLSSQLSYKDANISRLSRLNSSKLNRTIVNELIDPESDEDVMDRIETQNNIV